MQMKRKGEDADALLKRRRYELECHDARRMIKQESQPSKREICIEHEFLEQYSEPDRYSYAEAKLANLIGEADARLFALYFIGGYSAREIAIIESSDADDSPLSFVKKAIAARRRDRGDTDAFDLPATTFQDVNDRIRHIETSLLSLGMDGENISRWFHLMRASRKATTNSGKVPLDDQFIQC